MGKKVISQLDADYMQACLKTCIASAMEIWEELHDVEKIVETADRRLYKLFVKHQNAAGRLIFDLNKVTGADNT